MGEKLLLTGSSGFVGSRWLKRSQLRTVARPVFLRRQSVESIDWTDVGTVVHLAGIAHRMGQPSGPIYYEVNRDLSYALALAAKNNGVRQFVFVSTVKVFGDKVEFIDETTVPEPADDYGRSKREAEQRLSELSDDRFGVSTVRPPLIYGPDVKGNLLRIMKLLNSGCPVPFKGIHNRRSMVHVDNLIALLDTIIQQKAIGTFHAGDDRPLSTSELVELIYGALGRSPRWFKLPSPFVGLLRRAVPSAAERLFGSYVLDTRQTNSKLDFDPPLETVDGIRKMVASLQ